MTDWEQILFPLGHWEPEDGLSRLVSMDYLEAGIVARECAFVSMREGPSSTSAIYTTPAEVGADLFATGAALPPTMPARLDRTSGVDDEHGVTASRYASGDCLNDRYVILALLGVGGMGQVYLVYDRRRKRPIAIKTLHPHLHTPETENWLHNELATNEQVTHPNILRTYDLGFVSEEKRYFFTMEYVPGRSLASLLAGHPQGEPLFALTRVQSIIRQIGEALQLAHSRGVIHRDLKPANVLLSGKPGTHDVKLLDFGIALSGGEAGAGQQAVGTAYYMAPEQLRGEALTHQSDLYSLGVLAFQLLTGYVPQPGMPGPSGLVSALPSAVDAVIAKLMHWQPTQRFADARLFLDEWERAFSPGKSRVVPFRGSRSAASVATERTDSGVPVSAPTTAELIVLSQERDKAFSRLSERIDTKRPGWLETGMVREAPRSLEIDDSVAMSFTDRVLPGLPMAPDGVRRRMLLSRSGIPLLEFVHIPKGSFWMGLAENVEDARPQEIPRQTIELEGYWLSRTPVTNRVWSVFLEESGYQPLPSDRRASYLNHWPHGRLPAPLENHPVVWVSFSAAWAFCDFYGLSLPSEAQWEKACRSSDERLYPWGSEAPHSALCNFQRERGGVCEVGLFPAGASPYGVLGCAGNVFEWCADRWRPRMLASLDGASDPIVTPEKQTDRVTIRGGNYHTSAAHVRATFRQGTPLWQSAAHTGFRPVLDWKS
jgi:serine/threonine-protein kinase